MSGTASPSSDKPPATPTRSEPASTSKIRITLDLVTAGRRHLSFLRFHRAFSDPATVLRAIRRYEDLWLPLVAELFKDSPTIYPPPDVHWVWHCHCIDHPVKYRDYCALRFGTVIDRPAIFDDENEEYAEIRGREIWGVRYPGEPFDIEIDGGGDEGGGGGGGGEIFEAVARYRDLGSYFADPFVSETVYLVSAKRRYLDFLHLVRKLGKGGLRMVPTSDILFLWLTHKSFPVNYAKDMEGMEDLETKMIGFGVETTNEESKETKRIWEEAFDEPFERAGAWLNPVASPSRIFFNWEASTADVNRVYKGLQPRFLMEVCVFLKGKWEEREAKDARKTFLRLRTVRCHRELKLDKAVLNLSSDPWQKTWHLYCEFYTRGILIEIRQKGGSCLINSKLVKKVIFWWNDLLRASSLTLTRELGAQVRALASVTPPVQAPYLLKCVPDRVTDDSGTMISDVILKMNRYRPQEGRWLSRTVLDHAGRECFVIRIRVGRGIWRRGAETPSAVKWEDRIMEVREGPWSYVASSVGSAPEKVAGTATPKKEDSQEKKAIWCISTGDVLTIQWEDGLNLQLENENSTEPARLLRGRQLQYQTKTVSSSNATDEEEQYVTLVRFSPEYPDGKATALLNWKLLAVEFLPEEDAVLVLLLCMAIARTVSEITREDVAGLLVRARVREVRAGVRDWGSVMLPSSSAASASPWLQPWYWNAKAVLAPADERELTHKYSPADGKDAMYRQCIIP